MDLGVRTWGNDPDGSVMMLIGTYLDPGEIGQRLLRALPRLVVHRSDVRDSPLVPLLAAEISKDEPGQEVVLDRLLDLLLIAVLRAWFSRPEAEAPAWYHATSDPIVGPALRMLQNNPAHPWTVASLAAETGVSRAALRLPVHRSGGRAADDVPDRLADRARRRPAARAGRDRWCRRAASGLRQRVRAQHRLQAHARPEPERAPASSTSLADHRADGTCDRSRSQALPGRSRRQPGG